MTSPILLKVSALQVAYGGIQAVKGVDFEVREGELVSLIGSNGAGKTTTMKAITGTLPIHAGDIEYMGKSIKGQGPWDLVRQGLAMVPEGRGVFTRMTIVENLQMGAYIRDDDAEIAREIGMPDVYDQAWQRINWGGHLVTNWMGDMGFVRRLSGRITKPNFLGDLTKMNGKVTDCRKEANEALVDIEWWGTNQKDQRTCDGKATVRLPSRDISIQVL